MLLSEISDHGAPSEAALKGRYEGALSQVGTLLDMTLNVAKM